MNWKRTLSTLGIGMALGYFVKSKLVEMPIKPEKALTIAKDKFREGGEVSGSWIYMRAEALSLHGLNYLVYRGGITRTSNDENQQYEFYVDARTGTVVSTEKTSSII